MNAYDFVHMALLAEGGTIRGRTKLQKTVYFLGVLTGRLGELGYEPHYYGPYSADVADAVGRLKALGFVTETPAGPGAAAAGGFEMTRYDYALTADGRKTAQEKARRNPALWQALGRATQELRSGGQTDYMKLSIAAKTFFMLGQEKGKATTEQLAKLAGTFNWSVTPKQVEEACGFLQKLGLVRSRTA